MPILPQPLGLRWQGRALGRRLTRTALLMGKVPCGTYATPGLTSWAPFLDRHVALLLASQGALTWGQDLAQARIASPETRLTL
ncbi:MAG TPA: hypothetical protein VFY42_07100 [Gemmatimonadales bacterium]|nr:hypothetical protein [Gemmatimonadales bacterium]